ncbi:MAG: L-serine ammonia-lyase, iron-sulfur-dependent, subunit alpha [Bacteroidales bacterium]
MSPREKELIDLIHKEVKPALGCTEPIAVALATAKAVETLADGIGISPKDMVEWRLGADFSVKVEVSGNILKNGMGVGVPGTGMIGLPIAAALGAVCGKSALSLEVLHDLCEKSVGRAKELYNKGDIDICLSDTCKKLYVKAIVSLKGSADIACSIVEDDHDHVGETSFNGKVLFSDHKSGNGKCASSESPDRHLTVREIYDFASSANFDDISFILDDKKYNLALAEEGMKGDYGLRVGKTIRENQDSVFGDDFMSYAMGMTAAASDARMDGCVLPAMSNSGSGNQGITVSMPVIAYALRYDIDDERLARALILSNLTAIHIKSYLGKLSALCGCVVASTGSACGIVFLRSGSYEQVCAAIKNMIGNITGMVCDGAKVGCAMKVASGVYSSIQSAVLALNGICASEHDGIVDNDIEKTIINLGKIGSEGMQSTDSLILKIMACK